MRYGLLFFIMLILAACAPADPYAARAIADGQIQSTRAAANQAKAAQVEQAAEAEGARLATAGAAQVEIDLLQAQAQATVQAIGAEQAAFEAALLSGQATRGAEIWNASATPAAQQAQATATALQITIGYEAGKAARAQETARFWTEFLPILARILIIVIVALLCGFVWWVYKIARVDTIKRENEADWLAKKRSFVGAGGAWFYVNHDGEPIQVNFLRREWPRLNDGQEVEAENLADNYAETEEIRTEADPLKTEAIKLTSEIVAYYGDDCIELHGWRDLKEFNPYWKSSSKWQKGRGYLEAVGLIRQDGQQWQFVVGAREVLHRLNLPEVTR